MVTIKGYTNNPELRKKEVIPGTFVAVFKAVLTEEKEVLAEIEYAEEHGLNKGIKQTAKNMLERNMNIDVVEEITGLSLEEVIKLKEDI